MKGLLALLLCLAPVHALALSCLAPSVERSFDRYDRAVETYIVVHGRLALDTALLPEHTFGDDSPPDMTRIPARLVGKSLARNGSGLPFDKIVMLEVACFGPWCGGVGTGQNVLAFVRKDTDGYAIDINPCGGAVFEAPNRKALRAIKSCLQGKDCTPSGP